MNYELIEPIVGGPSIVKRTNADGSESFIPLDPGNTDYQEYLTYISKQAAD